MEPAPDRTDLSLLSGLAPELADTFVKVASDIAVVVGDDGVVRTVAEGQTPLQSPAEPWVGRPWVDTVTAETRRKIELLLQEAQTAGVSRRREVSHLGAGGAQIPVSWAAVRLGHAGPVLAVGRDLRAVAAIQQRFVDAQQEMERDYWQRRQAESRYRMLFQVARDAVLVLAANTYEVVEANAMAMAMFESLGPSPQGRPFGDCVPAASRARVEELLSKARASGRATELKVRVPDGGPPLAISATPFRADNRMCLLVRARSVDAAGSFFEQTPDPAVITDSAGRIRMANAAFLRLCQAQDEARLHGWPIGDAVGDTHNEWAALLAQVRANGLVGRAVVRLVVPGLPPLRAEVSGALLPDGDQEDIGFTLRVLPDDRAVDAGGPLAAALTQVAAQLGDVALPELLLQATQLAERYLIESALASSGGRIGDTAAALKIDADQLAERMHQLGLASRAFLN